MNLYSKKILNSLNLDIFRIISDSADELGIDSFVVGGFVRDLILAKTLKKDIDIMCVGSGIDLAKAVQKKITSKVKINIFKRYGTAMINHGDYQIEFVGSRKESYSKDSRNPSVESGNFMDDMLRRDFTINTLAISLNKDRYGELIDTFGGIQDLEKKIIVTPSEPNKTFSDDPLRMLRAIRFACQLNFNIDEKTIESILENSHRLKILSPERVSDEINKILMCENPSIGFKNLDKMNQEPEQVEEEVNILVASINKKFQACKDYRVQETPTNALGPFACGIFRRMLASRNKKYNQKCCPPGPRPISLGLLERNWMFGPRQRNNGKFPMTPALGIRT